MYEEDNEDEIQKILNSGKDMLNKITGSWTKVAIPVLIVVLGFMSFYQIEAEEVGLVMSFGKYVRQEGPGPHFKIPFVEKVERVAVERQQKLEFGFRTVRPGVNTQYDDTRSYNGESVMLTGDLNLADVEWVVQYRIENPYNYLFKAKNVQNTLRDISESAMRQVVGDRTVNEVITVGRTEMGVTLEELIQKICDEYELGVEIDQIVLQGVTPPDQVKPAFNEVNQATQEKETLINQAESDYNRVIPRAKGQADETIQKANGYATERINNAKGEVARFNDLYVEYLKSPQITKKRIYLETMKEVLPNLGNKIITDEDSKNVLPLLQMQLDKNK